mmetsp:Transcript_59071/g.105378  ORF Transcript_59071/g.105378 Transcript_59071/m.105378 type:complete len:205 (-) Transcript_59071:50-664(-)
MRHRAPSCAQLYPLPLLRSLPVSHMSLDWSRAFFSCRCRVGGTGSSGILRASRNQNGPVAVQNPPPGEDCENCNQNQLGSCLLHLHFQSVDCLPQLLQRMCCLLVTIDLTKAWDATSQGHVRNGVAINVSASRVCAISNEPPGDGHLPEPYCNENGSVPYITDCIHQSLRTIAEGVLDKAQIAFPYPAPQIELGHLMVQHGPME